MGTKRVVEMSGSQQGTKNRKCIQIRSMQLLYVCRADQSVNERPQEREWEYLSGNRKTAADLGKGKEDVSGLKKSQAELGGVEIIYLSLTYMILST